MEIDLAFVDSRRLPERIQSVKNPPHPKPRRRQKCRSGVNHPCGGTVIAHRSEAIDSSAAAMERRSGPGPVNGKSEAHIVAIEIVINNP
jgi:hypothetical protein